MMRVKVESDGLEVMSVDGNWRMTRLQWRFYWTSALSRQLISLNLTLLHLKGKMWKHIFETSDSRTVTVPYISTKIRYINIYLY